MSLYTDDAAIAGGTTSTPPLVLTCRRPRALWAASWCVLAVACTAAQTALGTLGSLALLRPFPIASFVATFFFLVASRPPARDYRLMLGASLAAGLGHRLWLHAIGAGFYPIPQTAALAVGVGALTALAARAWRSERDSEARSWFHAAVIVPAFVLSSGLALDLTVIFHRQVRDAVLLAMDASFGAQPSFVVGRLTAGSPELMSLLVGVYILLPMALGKISAMELQRRRGHGPDALEAFIVAGVIGFALYNLCPVVGPAPLFGSLFPATTPTVPGAPYALIDATAIGEPRNCMPSLHAAWTLLLYWHARPLGWVARLSAGAWMILTLIATLASGQHYAVDLVVAVPFAAFIDALVGGGALAQDGPRRRVLVGCAVLVGLWYAAILLAPATFIGTGRGVMIFAAVTVALGWHLHARWARTWASPLGVRFRSQ